MVDSLSTTIKLGLVVLATARFAATGADLEECILFAELARERIITRIGLPIAVDHLNTMIINAAWYDCAYVYGVHV